MNTKKEGLVYAVMVVIMMMTERRLGNLERLQLLYLLHLLQLLLLQRLLLSHLWKQQCGFSLIMQSSQCVTSDYSCARLDVFRKVQKL
jgi:hypothetical protein